MSPNPHRVQRNPVTRAATSIQIAVPSRQFPDRSQLVPCHAQVTRGRHSSSRRGRDTVCLFHTQRRSLQTTFAGRPLRLQPHHSKASSASSFAEPNNFNRALSAQNPTHPLLLSATDAFRLTGRTRPSANQDRPVATDQSLRTVILDIIQSAPPGIVYGCSYPAVPPPGTWSFPATRFADISILLHD